jgi:hypothetical protein
MRRDCIALVLAVAFTSVGVQADELTMKNGSRLVGEVVTSESGHIVFNTPFAGEIKIATENVLEVRTVKPVTLKMADGTIYKDKLIVSTEHGIAVRNEGETPIYFKAEDVALVNPEPWLLGEGYKWFGQMNAALSMERGNTDSDEYDLDFTSSWRSLDDRYILKGMYERDASSGVRDKNQWRIRGKYDRFSNQDTNNYFGGQLVFYQDEFADLDLRTTVGPYIGRLFFESSRLSLSGEVGAVYVDEAFDLAEDSDFVGGNWEVSMTSDIIPKTELYATQIGIVNFDQIDGVLIDTVIGLRFPLIAGLQTAFEIKLEYDGGAVDDVDELDQTYNFKLGYTW